MIPQALIDLPQWVVARANKVPLNPRTLHAASVTDLRTWGTHAEARAAVSKHATPEYPLHLGFVFTKDDPFIGVDLDSPINDEQQARHTQIYEAVQTYTEYSVSKRGVHLIARGSIPHAAKRDKVEVYDRERFFIMTGDTLRDLPIADYGDFFTQLVQQMQPNGAVALSEHDEPEREHDYDVWRRCAAYANGEQFRALWQGDMQGYGSQSEADFALINMLAFASRNNAQCKRLFRESALGQRDKAQREDYLNKMLAQIRAEQNPPPIDLSQLKPPEIFTPTLPTDSIPFPPGLVGRMAQYILASAYKPVPEVALLGALGLIAGLAGRSYVVSNTGLNLYLMLVADTGIGKEGAVQGIERLLGAVETRLPAVREFLEPSGNFASGQALVKHLNRVPCFVSVFSEFGHTLSRICHPHANAADVMLRKLFLELFNRSGPKDVLGKIMYSDTGKNTDPVASPAFSVLTESTAEALFDALDERSIEIGLVPRFLLLECNAERPRTNPNAWHAPDAELVAQLEALAHRCLSMGANNSRCYLRLTPAARTLLNSFDREVDDLINAQQDNSIRQLWSRANLKVLRVAGLLAVGTDFDHPVIDTTEATWAIDLVRKDVRFMLRRFGLGVGVGDVRQLADLRRIIVNTLQGKTVSRIMRQHNVFDHRAVQQRAYRMASFRHDRRGAGEALKRALQALRDSGELIELSPRDVETHFKTSAKCYMLTERFQQDDAILA